MGQEESKKPFIDPIKQKKDSQIESTAPSKEEIAEDAQQSYPDQEMEFVGLPSKGIFYKGRFHKLAKLKIRKLNWMDEDILTTRSYYDNGTLFKEILKNVIVDDNSFKGEDLVALDRDTILIWLRIGAFGSSYIIPHKCKEKGCDGKENRTWDLGDFDIPKFNPDYEEELIQNGEVSTTLPKSKEVVKVTVPSIGREETVQSLLKKEKEDLKTTRDFLITGRLLSTISAVTGSDGQEIRGMNEIYNWMKRNPTTKRPLDLIDSRHIQKIAREIDVKIDTKKKFECSKCRKIQEDVEMPMGIHFFWPEYDKIS